MTSQNRFRRLWVGIGSVLAIGLAVGSLAGCSASKPSSSSSATTMTEMSVAAATGPISLDPGLNGNGTPLIWYTQLDYASLIHRDQDGTAKPELATSWHYSTDRLSFVINLRKDVQFSDGEPLTADAVVNSLLYSKAHSSFQFLSNVSTITATGPLQVTLTLTTPDPLIPFGIDQEGQEGAIIAPAGLKNPQALGTQSFGAGQYVVDTKDTIANSAYVYTANPKYWNQKAIHFKKITIKVITDNNSTLAALRSGQVQAAGVDANTATAGQAAGLNLTAVSSAMVAVYLSDIDGTIQPQFANQKVRQALNLAINRPAITKAIYGKYAIPTDQYSAKGTPGYVPSLEKTYAYDPKKAKQLLADAGYPNGFSFNLIVQPGALNQNLLAQSMVQDWKAIGVTVTLSAPTAFADWVTQNRSLKFPATTLNFAYSNHLTMMQGLFTNPALYNKFTYVDKQSNDYATQERLSDVGTAANTAVAEKYSKYVVDQAFAVPVASVDTLLLTSKNLKNVQFSAAYPIPDLVSWMPAK